jgi:hypothetical protein
MTFFKESEDHKKIKQFVDTVINSSELSDNEKIEVARKISESVKPFGHKELGFNMLVRDFGNENIGVKNARIYKAYDQIEIDLNNPGNNDEERGENHVTIMPMTDKKGNIKDIRIHVHRDDMEYYFDEPPGIDVIVLKRNDQPTDKELLEKINKKKAEKEGKP